MVSGTLGFVFLRILCTPHERHNIVILLFFEPCQIDGLPSLFIRALIEKRGDLAIVGLCAEIVEIFGSTEFWNHHALGRIVGWEVMSLYGFFAFMRRVFLEGGSHLSSHAVEFTPECRPASGGG